MSRPPNLCIYCGQPGVTKEHIWGQWAIKHNLVKGDRSEHWVEIPVGTETRKGENRRKGALNRNGTSRHQSLRIACRPCNNGWMSDIVKNAAPTLKNMNYGYWGKPTPEEAMALAKWITLTSMSLEHADRASGAVTFEDRNRFRQDQEISRHWRIAVGQGRTPLWDSWYHRSMRIEDSVWSGNPNVHVTAFYFGSLFALSYYCEHPIPFDFSWVAKDMGLVPLWPDFPDQLSRPFRNQPPNAVDLVISRFSDVWKAVVESYDPDAERFWRLPWPNES